MPDKKKGGKLGSAVRRDVECGDEVQVLVVRKIQSFDISLEEV